MHKKLIREALMFWGPLTIPALREKLEMRGVDLNEDYISSLVKKMNSEHSVIVLTALDGEQVVKL